MKHLSKVVLPAAAIVGVTLFVEPAWAGGIILYEIATPDVGLASAGYAARADDASTLFKNPAGMSRLEGAQFQGGLQATYGSVSFSPDGNTSAELGADDGGNAIGWLPAGSVFVTVPLGKDWHIGLGAFSYFGLAEKYDDNWVGRYYVQDSALIGMSIMPSVSYKVNEWLSLGAGLNAMYGILDTDIAVNNRDAPIGPDRPDGQMTLNDTTWGFGANFGVMIQASEKTRFGVTYLSPVKLDFADTPSFSGLLEPLETLLANPAELDLGVTVPQSVMVSAFHELNEHWALMANFGWQNWSQFGKVQVGVEPGGTTTLDLKYQDTFHGAVGAQYRASDKWLFSGGMAYDSSPVASEDRTVTLPLGKTWRFGLGAQYQVSQAIQVGAGCTFMWAGDLSVDQGTDGSLRGRVSGSYDSAWFTIASLSMIWKF